ncbi:MAG: class I SAM-dependent methyltransferase [Calditrichia bacterium]|nr:class I SAM-dependent methyltransferase [Calditrichia bacterium]
MKKLHFFALRPKIRKFLISFFRNNYALDIETQLRIRALKSTCKYIEQNMVDIPLYNKSYDALEHALREVSIKGIYCEFGVYKGSSINYIAKKVSQKVHGFDSFEGLPETWLSTHKKGHFALKKTPVFEENVVIHKGWFEDTLPLFVKENLHDIAFLHIDCDLYSSTCTIFKHLNKNIVENTIIVFDEYFNFPFWEHHEFKAFQEFVKENEIKYKYLCYSSKKLGSKVVIKIIKH